MVPTCYTLRMHTRQYISLMLLGTCGAIAAWTTVVFMINPVDGGLPAVVLFYITTFVALLGVCVTVATIFRSLQRHASERHHVRVSRAISRSFRQGVFFAFLGTVSLWCLASGFFSITLFFLLFIAIVIVELLFLRKEETLEEGGG